MQGALWFSPVLVSAGMLKCADQGRRRGVTYQQACVAYALLKPLLQQYQSLFTNAPP